MNNGTWKNHLVGRHWRWVWDHTDERSIYRWRMADAEGHRGLPLPRSIIYSHITFITRWSRSSSQMVTLESIVGSIGPWNSHWGGASSLWGGPNGRRYGSPSSSSGPSPSGPWSHPTSWAQGAYRPLGAVVPPMTLRRHHAAGQENKMVDVGSHWGRRATTFATPSFWKGYLSSNPGWSWIKASPIQGRWTLRC
jgi:hypothetical protein